VKHGAGSWQPALRAWGNWSIISVALGFVATGAAEAGWAAPNAGLFAGKA